MTDYFNDKNPLWNSEVSKPSARKYSNYLKQSDFKISAPRSPTHCTPQRNDNVLDITHQGEGKIRKLGWKE
jgi:hypothetical protein